MWAGLRDSLLMNTVRNQKRGDLPVEEPGRKGPYFTKWWGFPWTGVSPVDVTYPWDDALRRVLPPNPDPHCNRKKTSDKRRLRAARRDTWAELFSSVQVTEDRSTITDWKEVWQLNAIWDPSLDPWTEQRHEGKSGQNVNGVRSLVIVLYQRQFLGFDECPRREDVRC